MPLLEWFKSAIEAEYHIAVTLGLLLGASVLAGFLSNLIRLPKVTAYLLVGLMLGPSLINAIPESHVSDLEPVIQLAMALVLFRLGTHFSFGLLRRQLTLAWPTAIGDAVATLSLVTVGLLLVGMPFTMALLLGCLAIATAPATTILVLQEVRSEGPVTERTQTLVALNNFICIVMFEVCFVLFHQFSSSDANKAIGDLLRLGGTLFGSLILGILGGLVISYACGFLKKNSWLVLLIAVTTLVLGIAVTFELSYMLTFLAMGVIVANSSEVSQQIAEELDHITGLLCVIFFAVHGAELHLDAAMAVGMAGMVYIVARVAGKLIGNYLGARMAGQPSVIRRYVGPSLLAQAGAAIALASMAVTRAPELGVPILQIILGSVVIFEIAGPLLVRAALLRAGEVPLAQAIHHTDQTPVHQFQSLWDRLWVAWHKTSDATEIPRALDTPIEPLIRRNVKGISRSASFDQVISHIEHSHDNTYPVVDDNNVVVGVIRYPLLANVMFDRHVSDLVRAEDLSTPTGTVLHEDASLNDAVEALQRETDDCLPVVSRETPISLIGVVRRSDVMHLLVQRRRRH